MIDKKIEEFLNNICDENIKKSFLRTQEMMENINTFAQNEIMKAQLNPSKEVVEKMEKYMPLLQEFMIALKDKRDFITMKGATKALMNQQKKIENIFSEENLNKQYENFQKKIDEKSKEYARM